MTIQENTICNLIQTFPVLLILAQKQNKCLETQFVYKPPSPTQTPEYYQALDALFQNLYGHTTQPCYYSSKYGTKPCNYGSPGVSYGSHGTSYGSHGYGIGSYGAHAPSYGSPGTGYGSPGVYFVPSFKKGNIYSANVTYGHGYASTQSYTNNRNKIVVKKTRISRRKKKSEKLQAGLFSDIRNTISGTINAVGNILHPQKQPVRNPTRVPNIVSIIKTTAKPEQARPSTGGEPCTSVNGGRGECLVISTCQPFMELMRKSISSPVFTWMLRQAHCGFNGNDAMVCCPIEDRKDDNSNQIDPVDENNQNEVTTSTLPTTTSTLPPTTTLPTTTSSLPPTTTTLPITSHPVVSTRRPKPITPDYDLLSLVGETCRTVYNTTGSCIDIHLCDPFLALVKQARSKPAVQDVLKKAACGFKRGIAQVCCPLPGQSTEEIPPTTTMATITTTTHIPSEPRNDGDYVTALPEPPFCGLSNISLDRVVGGVPAKLGAFPWMALLGYKDESVAAGLRWKCGGALVTSRHVLTAAHCIHNLENDLFVVRLGELDLARDDEGATPTDVSIKTMYEHELYTPNNPVINDVGVLVLERDVTFTDLIKPICLFTTSSNMYRSHTFEDYTPFVAGWGDVKWQGISATHLQVAQLPVLGSEECERAYIKHIRSNSREQFSEQAMCAGYPGGKIDSCSGDSGGPLMQPLELKGRTPRTYMFAIGIVSFGRQCARAGSPGVYARVSHYMPWIQEKILGRAS